MSHPPSHGLGESIHVIYSGSLSIPLCVGSIAIPLTRSDSSNGGCTLPSSHAAVPALSSSPESSHPRRQPRENGSDGVHINGGRRKGKRPTTSSKPAITTHRYTHRRYCYLRDGSELSEDCFYRWLLFHTGGMQQQPTCAESAQETQRNDLSGKNSSETESAGMQRKRPRTDDDQGKRDGEDNSGDESKAEAHLRSSSPSWNAQLIPKSPSLLYSFVDRVEFIVPASFSKPRRVVRTPPFLIEDDTWAEHLVEIIVHFQPHLAIPPAQLMHQVLLQSRVAGMPIGLLSRNQGLPKPSTMVLIGASSSSWGEDLAEVDAINLDDASKEARWKSINAAITVSERQDALRVLHPSYPVLQHFRRVLAKQELPLIERLRAYFLTNVFCGYQEPESAPTWQEEAHPAGTAPDVVPADESAITFTQLPKLYQGVASASPLPPPEHGFLLPAEACLFSHVKAREARCVHALGSALSDLAKEQDELCEGIDKTLMALHSGAGRLKEQLDKLHELCLKKQGNVA